MTAEFHKTLDGKVINAPTRDIQSVNGWFRNVAVLCSEDIVDAISGR